MRFAFSRLGDVFATRERGTTVRNQIEESLREVADDEVLVLDFDAVQLISFSFADEVVGRLVELAERPVFVVNASDEVVQPIVASMERRKLLVAYPEPGGVRLLGAPEHIVRAFQAVQDRGEFRTPELAADLGITTSAANNRVQPLLRAGLLTRRASIARAGGREYIYRVVLPSLETAAA